MTNDKHERTFVTLRLTYEEATILEDLLNDNIIAADNILNSSKFKPAVKVAARRVKEQSE